MFQGSCVALITPMLDSPAGQSPIDWEAYDQLLAWHQAAKTAAVVIGGTTGESATLAPDEYEALVQRAVERLGGHVLVIAGTGSSSTAQTIEKTQRAGALGADAALVVTPAYNRPSQRGLMAHYLAVADHSPLPVVLYNVPSRTAVDLSPETAIVLNEHERIVGIKEAVPDLARLQKLIDAGMNVFSGDDPSFVAALKVGAAGVISVAANVVPRTMVRLCQAAVSKDTEVAQVLDQSLQPLYAFLGVETNPVPVKWLLAKMGRCQDSLRLPLVSLDSQYHGEGERLISHLERHEFS
jgi:4-hydroxy-tetrahydrodipicolinate synthase